jgi:hypothetical protein
LIFEPADTIRPGRRLCEMTMPLFRVREYIERTLPVLQCLFAIVRLAAASRLPTTFGTLHVGLLSARP